MVTVSELWIYPIKSCRGIQLEETEVDAKGFKNDRRFMIVDTEGQMITQRQYHQMALIETGIAGESLELSAPGLEKIKVPLQPKEKDWLKVQVWSDTCNSLEVSREANQWLSIYMGFECKLVYMPDETRRVVDTRYNFTKATTTFTDGFPVLLISQASLNDLNSRLECPVPMNRFRPNMVVNGTQPFEEDLWRSMKAGAIRFDVVKPCSRCVMTTVDQSSGTTAGKEPLKTLASYRSMNNKIYFGQNLIHIEKKGMIKIGDVISTVLKS